jgi:hypothetical protein
MVACGRRQLRLRQAVGWFSQGNPVARRLGGNAIAGRKLGFYSRTALLRFMRAMDKDSFSPSPSSDDPDDLVTRVKLIRFGNRGTDGRIEINDKLLPLPKKSVESSCIHGSHVLSVMGLSRLKDLLPASFLTGDMSPYSDPSFPMGKKDELAALARHLKDLPVESRRFELTSGKQIGNPILWFTSEQVGSFLDKEFERRQEFVRRKTGKFFGLSRADWYVASIGLGHWKPCDWLALLRIPKSAVERAGHYRPAFPDGATYQWFMVAANAAEGQPCDEWGRTVDLRLLRKSGAVRVVGVHERVARQLQPADFKSPAAAGQHELIEFEVLGKVTKDWGPTQRAVELADRIARGASTP